MGADRGKGKQSPRRSSPFMRKFLLTITHLFFPEKITPSVTDQIELRTFKTKIIAVKQSVVILDMKRTRTALKQFRKHSNQYTSSLIRLIYKRYQHWKKQLDNINDLNERIAVKKQFCLFAAENIGAIKAYNRTHSDLFVFNILQTKLKQLNETKDPDKKRRLSKRLHQFLGRNIEAIKRYNRKQGRVPKDVDLILHIAFLMKKNTDPHVLSNDERKVSTRLLDFAETQYDYFRTLLDEDRLPLAMMKLLMQVEARWRAEVYTLPAYTLNDNEKHNLSILQKHLATINDQYAPENSTQKARAIIGGFFKQVSLTLITTLASADTALYNFCKTADLTDYWQERLTTQAIFKTQPNFRLRPQEKRHTFDQLIDFYGKKYSTQQPRYKQRANKEDAYALFDIFDRDQRYTTRYRVKLTPHDCFNDRTLFASLPNLARHGAIYHLAMVGKIFQDITDLRQLKQSDATELLQPNYGILWSMLRQLKATLITSGHSFHNATEGKNFSWLRLKIGEHPISTFGGVVAFFQQTEDKDNIHSNNRIIFSSGV